MIALDTSVALPALAAWHANHDAMTPLLAGASITAHAALETYAVLTRIGPPHRMPAPEAAELLRRTFVPSRVLAPSDDLAGDLPRRLAAAGVSGGASYDALVGLTAAEAGAELLTRDRRAARTYDALAVPYRLVS